MGKALALITVLSVCVLGGCKSDDGHAGQDSRGEMKSQRTPAPAPTPAMSADACTHCAGMQTAKADGTCPMCGMKIK